MTIEEKKDIIVKLAEKYLDMFEMLQVFGMLQNTSGEAIQNRYGVLFTDSIKKEVCIAVVQELGKYLNYDAFFEIIDDCNYSTLDELKEIYGDDVYIEGFNDDISDDEFIEALDNSKLDSSIIEQLKRTNNNLKDRLDDSCKIG